MVLVRMYVVMEWTRDRKGVKAVLCTLDACKRLNLPVIRTEDGLYGMCWDGQPLPHEAGFGLGRADGVPPTLAMTQIEDLMGKMVSLGLIRAEPPRDGIPPCSAWRAPAYRKVAYDPEYASMIRGAEEPMPLPRKPAGMEEALFPREQVTMGDGKRWERRGGGARTVPPEAPVQGPQLPKRGVFGRMYDFLVYLDSKGPLEHLYAALGV